MLYETLSQKNKGKEEIKKEVDKDLSTSGFISYTNFNL